MSTLQDASGIASGDAPDLPSMDVEATLLGVLLWSRTARDELVDEVTDDLLDDPRSRRVVEALRDMG